MRERLTVIEYLGLPGVGKTWHLGPSGFRGRSGAISSAVPPGRSLEKRSNTLRGMLKSPRLLLLLLWSALTNWRSLRRGTSLRPILVVFERIERINRLKRMRPSIETHVDEGVLQFVWRTFSQLEVNERNQRLLKRCLTALPGRVDMAVAYFSCPVAQHLEQVISRGKGSDFDLAVIRGSDAEYRRGREWMATLMLLARRSGIDIEYVGSMANPRSSPEGERP
jgi:hypothetical protein